MKLIRKHVALLELVMRFHSKTVKLGEDVKHYTNTAFLPTLLLQKKTFDVHI